MKNDAKIEIRGENNEEKNHIYSFFTTIFCGNKS